MDGMEKIKAIIHEQEQNEFIAFLNDAVTHSAGAGNGNPESVAWVKKILQAGFEHAEVWEGIPRCVLLVAVDHYLNNVTAPPSASSSISGQTIERLQRAIAAFPTRYPEYQTNPPKLINDVRPWLHDIGVVRDGAEGREAVVFGRIISEHFGFSPDTLKSQ